MTRYFDETADPDEPTLSMPTRNWVLLQNAAESYSHRLRRRAEAGRDMDGDLLRRLVDEIGPALSELTGREFRGPSRKVGDR